MLAKGLQRADAAKEAKKFMNTAFKKSFSAGRGMKLFNI